MIRNSALLRISLTWLVLVVLTLASWSAMEDAAFGGSVAAAWDTGLVVVAFVKVWLIGMQFMEIRRAPMPLVLLFHTWLIGAAGVLIGLCWSTIG
jgi:Prokaryotic Cytochrome C oxidase subunit IV